MSDQLDLESVIEDSVNDATSTSDETTEDATPEATDTETETTEETTTEVTPETSQVTAPGASTETTEAVEDEFAKRFGIQGQSITGRENRIPYSRVKKIVERAEKEALAKAKKEFEGAPQPKLQEYETKVKDYEDRLGKVAQFEHMIEFQPREFLNFLSGLPAYKEFFEYIQQLSAGQQQQQTKTEEPYLDVSTMPQPDEKLADGSMVYSLKGLNARDEWVARQVEARAIKAAEDRIAKRYAPMQEAYEQEQRRQQAIPTIQKKISEARQWPGFTENEAEIIEVLRADQNITLEAAYQKVYIPKLQAQMQALQPERDRMRQEVLEELRKKPAATSATTTQTKPGKLASGPRSLEDVIREAAETLKR